MKGAGRDGWAAASFSPLSRPASDAENAGLNDIAQFFRDTMKDDSSRAARAHELLKNISCTSKAGPAAQ